MFPHVIAHDGVEAIGQRIILVRGRNHLQAAGAVRDEPCPTRTKALRARIIECCLECIKGAKSTVNRAGQLTGRCTTTIGLHNLPEHRVVGVTTTVVTYSGANALRDLAETPDNVFYYEGCKIVILQSSIQIVYIGCMMLIVMQLHRLGIDVRLKRIVVVRKWWKLECHKTSLLTFMYHTREDSSYDVPVLSSL